MSPDRSCAPRRGVVLPSLAPAVLVAAAAVPELAALALLATIQGLTEFLPISSSGHLVLAQGALGMTAPDLTLDVVLHLGTLVAVLIVYRRDVRRILGDLVLGRWRESALVLLATLPASYVGLVHGDRVEALFGSPTFAAKMLFVTAAILVVGELARRRRASAEERPLSPGAGVQLPAWWGALVIGLAQALAILPGISRSGSTIAAGLAIGLAPVAAARFSFLLAIPAILGAAVLQSPDAFARGAEVAPGGLLFAAALAGAVGWVALRLLLAFLGRGAFAWFAVYCAVAGAVALALTA